MVMNDPKANEKIENVYNKLKDDLNIKLVDFSKDKRIILIDKENDKHIFDVSHTIKHDYGTHHKYYIDRYDICYDLKVEFTNIGLKNLEHNLKCLINTKVKYLN
jgi:hypothetical protein